MKILVALLLQATSGQPEATRNFTYEHKTPSGEFITRVTGEEANVLDVEKKIVEIRKVRAEYYTEPQKPDDRSETIVAEADRGLLDEDKKIMHLKDRVRVVRERDGTVVEASSALVDFDRGFECVACALRQSASGNCPRCQAPLKRKTFTTLRVDKEFLMIRGGDASLTGEGLMGDDALRQLSVARNGSLKLTGSPSQFSLRSNGSLGGPVTRLSSAGPLQMMELGDGTRAIVSARDQVRVSREDGPAGGPGNFSVACDTAEILVHEVIDPKDPQKKKPEVEKITAQGALRFEDSTGMAGSAETLEWERADGVAHLTGSPFVVTEQGPNRVRARRVEVRQAERMSVFSGDVTADFVPPQGDPRSPLQMKSKTLTARSSPPDPDKKSRLESIEAEGEVEIGLPLARNVKEPGVAKGDRFVYDLAREQGRLEATPFVRVTQGESVIVAPRLLMSGASALIVQGPKRLRLVQVQDGKKMTVHLTSEADIVLDPESGRMSLREECVVRTEEFTLYADRVDLTVGEKGMQALTASGHLRAVRPREGLTVYGERMRFNPADESLSIIGVPDAVAESGKFSSRQREIRFHLKERRVEWIGHPGRVRMIFKEGK